jgi:uncharacterized protein YrzB (UPF0473 family)
MDKDKKGHEVSSDPETEDAGVVVLVDEDGKESRFRILFDSLFVEDTQYVVLMPADDEEALEPEIVILRVAENRDGEGILVTIDSDEEWVEVLKAFEEMDVEEALGDVEVLLDDTEERKPPRH